PSLRRLDLPDVDSVEQHRELGCVELCLNLIGSDLRQAETAALETLVIDHETTSVPGQDLDPVAPPAPQHLEITAGEIVAALGPHRAETIDRLAQIDRCGGQIDPHRRGQRQHGYVRRLTSAETYSSSVPVGNRRQTPLGSSTSTTLAPPVDHRAVG